jgi:hypothetical protein
MRRKPTVLFARHYAEMVLVMLAGMLLIGGLLLLIASGLGLGRAELQDDFPGLMLAGMGFSMTAPMVAWMHWRGHSWTANGTMALAMALPTAAALVLLATGAIGDLHTLFMIEHTAMLPLMLAAMLPFRAEYTRPHRAGAMRPATG